MRLRDECCIETKAKDWVQTAHIISRSYKSTAWDLDNVVLLSAKRHCFYTHRPVEWKKFINEYFGEGYYEEMERRALDYHKWSLGELKELYAELCYIRDNRYKPEWRILLYANPGRTSYPSAGGEPTTKLREGWADSERAKSR